jgi:hypothetical protein
MLKVDDIHVGQFVSNEAGCYTRTCLLVVNIDYTIVTIVWLHEKYISSMTYQRGTYVDYLYEVQKFSQ